jgi:hypothetical protein
MLLKAYIIAMFLEISELGGDCIIGKLQFFCKAARGIAARDKHAV